MEEVSQLLQQVLYRMVRSWVSKLHLFSFWDMAGWKIGSLDQPTNLHNRIHQNRLVSRYADHHGRFLGSHWQWNWYPSGSHLASKWWIPVMSGPTFMAFAKGWCGMDWGHYHLPILRDVLQGLDGMVLGETDLSKRWRSCRVLVKPNSSGNQQVWIDLVALGSKFRKVMTSTHTWVSVMVMSGDVAPIYGIAFESRFWWPGEGAGQHALLEGRFRVPSDLLPKRHPDDWFWGWKDEGSSARAAYGQGDAKRPLEESKVDSKFRSLMCWCKSFGHALKRNRLKKATQDEQLKTYEKNLISIDLNDDIFDLTKTQEKTPPKKPMETTTKTHNPVDQKLRLPENGESSVGLPKGPNPYPPCPPWGLRQKRCASRALLAMERWRFCLRIHKKFVETSLGEEEGQWCGKYESCFFGSQNLELNFQPITQHIHLAPRFDLWHSAWNMIGSLLSLVPFGHCKLKRLT